MIGNALRLTAIALGASALCLTSIAAQAQSTTRARLDVRSPAWWKPQVRDKVVSYSDLDLNTTAGQTTMFNRLKVASRHVCGPKSAASVARAQYKRCYDEAMTTALSNLGNSQITAMYHK
ncbi:MAG TPA: UrcA family protein [Caulobacteraceae bacterium]